MIPGTYRMHLRDTFLQLLLYLVVGGLATLVEWGTFFVLNVPLSHIPIPRMGMLFSLPCELNEKFSAPLSASPSGFRSRHFQLAALQNRKNRAFHKSVSL